MKKLLLLFVIIVAIYSLGYCEQYQEFSRADSLFAQKQYLPAVEAYPQFLDGDKADFALYKTGLSKNGIAEFCVSKNKFDKYPETYKKNMGTNIKHILPIGIH